MYPRNNNERWIRCTGCGHKLGRIIKAPTREEGLIEMKCHSCKTINIYKIKEDK